DGHVTGVQTCALPISETTSGTLGAFHEYGSGARISVGEVTGDGVPDVVSVSRDDPQAPDSNPGLMIFRNTGAGALASQTTFASRSEERRVGKEGRLRW